jgi:NAD(P)-dependent dehydrogenase (short-subunit alcohol dehydrogenase family)
MVFANAGIVETVETPAATPEHFDRTFNTNARGAYFTVQKALPLLNDGASIILNGSGAWQKGIPIYGTYSATKELPARTSERGRQNSQNVESART